MSRNVVPHDLNGASNVQVAQDLRLLVKESTMRRTLEKVSTPDKGFIRWESVLHCSLTARQRQLDKDLRIKILQVCAQRSGCRYSLSTNRIRHRAENRCWSANERIMDLSQAAKGMLL